MVTKNTILLRALIIGVWILTIAGCVPFLPTPTPTPTPTPQPNTPTTLDDGHKIYNVAADFITYAEQNAQANAATRKTQWDQMLESKYTDFFNDVIYRGKTGQDREDYKATVIDQFWNDVVPRLSTLKQVSSGAVQNVLTGRTTFKNAFSDFDPQADYYLTVSFSFKGKAVEVAGHKGIGLGLEYFGPNDIQLDMTIAHEQFHLYHFTTFSPQGGLYRGVWSEGMAVYAVEHLMPGYDAADYLGFTADQMDSMNSAFYDLTDDIRTNLGSSDQAIKRAYLGAEDNDLGIPPMSGYYVGYYLVKALIDEGNTLGDMTRWDANTVYNTMDEILPELEQP